MPWQCKQLRTNLSRVSYALPRDAGFCPAQFHRFRIDDATHSNMHPLRLSSRDLRGQVADTITCPQCGHVMPPTARGPVPTAPPPANTPRGTIPPSPALPANPGRPVVPPGARRPAAAFLVEGTDKAERKNLIPLLAFPVALLVLAAIVWWEPWNSSTDLLVDDPSLSADPDSEVAESETAIAAYESVVAKRPPISLPTLASTTTGIESDEPIWRGVRLPKFDLPRGARTLTAVSGASPRFLAIDGAVYQLRDKKLIANNRLPSIPLRIAVSQNGTHAAVVALEGERQAIVLHTAAGNSPPRTIELTREQTPVRYMAFAGADRLIAQLGFGTGSKLQIWDAASGAMLEQLDAQTIDENRAALTSDGEMLALVGAGSIEIISTRGGATTATLTHPSLMNMMPFSRCRASVFRTTASTWPHCFPVTESSRGRSTELC